MARIALDSRTTKSITVYMTELDTNYNGTIRNIFWNIKKSSESSYSTVKSGTIANQISQTGTYKLSGLSPSTSYDIKCIINNINGSGSATFTRTISTEDPPVSIDDFYADTTPGSKSVTLRFSYSGAPSSYTFWIGYRYGTSGSYSYTSATKGSVKKNITVSDFGYYSAIIEMREGNSSSGTLLASDTCTFRVRDYNTSDVTPSGISLTRIDYGTHPAFICSISGADYASDFYVKFTDGSGNSYTKHTTSSSFTLSSSDATNFNHLQSYSVSVRGTGHSLDSGFVDFYSITTSPPQPTITNVYTASQSVTATYDIKTSVNGITVKAEILNNRSTVVGSYTDTPPYDHEFPNVTPGTYTLRACSYTTINGTTLYAVDSSGSTYYATYSVTVTDRPTNFSWTYPKVQGNSVVLTASEWNSFTSKINEFRRWKGLSNASFTTAVSGNVITAAIYNQARTAIEAITGNSIPSVSSGSYLTASCLNTLVTQLNSIQ